MRLSTSNLITTLETDTLLGNATGAPYALSTVIQQAVNKILSELCLVDSQLENLIKTPLDVVTNQLDTYLSGLIDKSTFVNAYLQIQNLFDARNIISVYRATGNPDDDGYLTAEASQNDILSKNSPESFIYLYSLAVNNPSHYSLPRTFRLGMTFTF